MKIKDIKDGQILRITGSHSGCNGGKCINCVHYQEHIIRVEKLEEDILNGKRTVKGWKLNGHEFCNFNPADLTPLSWKERFKNE